MNKLKEKKKSYILALFSCLGMCGILATSFFGGIILWLFSFWYIIIPVFVIYIVSLFSSITDLFNGRYSESKLKINIHLLSLALIITFNLYDSELIKNNKILSATLRDDLYHYTLTLRENGECETKCSGVFGYEEYFKGTYKFKGDTIIFTKTPYDKVGFISDTILYDKKQKAIFIENGADKKFIRKKNFLNHFEIDR